MPDFQKITSPNAGADAFDQVIDDAYFTGQTDNGKGAPLSSYFLNHVTRWANYAYVKLFDKDAGETTPRLYRTGAPRGHDHSGDSGMGEFIGVNLTAVIQGIENDAYTRGGGTAGLSQALPAIGTLSLAAAAANAFKNINAFEDSNGTGLASPFAGVAHTIPAITVGPGVDRLDVSLLLAVFVGSTLKTGACTGKLQCKVTTAAGTVTKDLSVSGGVSNFSTGLLWAHITSASLLPVTAGAENWIDIEFAITDEADNLGVLLYSYVIAEEHS